MIEDGTVTEDLSKTALDNVRKHLNIRRWGAKTHVAFNEAACSETKKYHGFFALVSNCEKDPLRRPEA
jgi:hypothetical protein